MKSIQPIVTLLVIVASIILAIPDTGLSGPTEIKIAVVMPEGSTWTSTLHEFADAVMKETGGGVAIKIYAGGIAGDEVDVLRKMRANRLHAGGFSGVGLGLILPEIRIFEAPLLFNTYEEIDYVKEKMFDDFAGRFEEKGYVLLGFAEAGFVYLFSKQRIDSMDRLQQTRMWVWKGDRVAENFLDAFGIQGYPLQLADVNTGLETGMIDSFYSPALASVAFQWYARVKYMLDFPMVNSTGALLMNKRAFYDLNPENREIVNRLVKQYAARLVQSTRKENVEAVMVLRQAGIMLIPPTPEQAASFKQNAEINYQMSIPSLYSKELFDQVRGLIAEYRKKVQ
jgi:TRAP-type transport system periplasmic protein